MTASTTTRGSKGWFYVAMAVVAMVLTIIGFGPALVDTASRRAPLTLAVSAHGLVFAAWLLLFLAQTLLVKRRFAAHRRLGYAGAVLAVMMVVSGYATSIAMARRSFDLRGDLIGATGDPLELLVFQLGDLANFWGLGGNGGLVSSPTRSA